MTTSVGSWGQGEWEVVGEVIILAHSNIARAKRWRQEFRAHEKIKIIMMVLAEI